MDYSKIYNKVLKYSTNKKVAPEEEEEEDTPAVTLAPKEGVATWATHSINNGTAAKNNPDGQFADWLQDHNDPRHEIVRRDISYRTSNNDSYRLMMNHAADARKLFGENANLRENAYTHLDLEDGSLRHAPYEDEGSVVGHKVQWKPRTKPGEAIRANADYVSNFSNEEFDKLMSDLGHPQHNTRTSQALVTNLNRNHPYEQDYGSDDE